MNLKNNVKQGWQDGKVTPHIRYKDMPYVLIGLVAIFKERFRH